ncbi:hypothetical protein PCH_Pc19g00230 [Penicillium rubens Wisconsin 54-1255]|uniref:Uncharacterized protein n=1 Tax=Penicillium rubens (strain ATCC 28089 / DSM 1075 / NRRL 1951 / Wisconsin 54-1255) TaxID=500485 RepID=B6HD16_PENRW|nr:hypothetical protein PCH_Pc19g00230 [Penicillium rubens Wisconsin 54-1255]
MVSLFPECLGMPEYKDSFRMQKSDCVLGRNKYNSTYITKSNRAVLLNEHKKTYLELADQPANNIPYVAKDDTANVNIIKPTLVIRFGIISTVISAASSKNVFGYLVKEDTEYSTPWKKNNRSNN